jgi:heme/copper-type cytochrome/quinol oxidase subunit 3
MPTGSTLLIPDRHAAGRARQVRYFFGVAAIAILAGSAIAWLLIKTLGLPEPTQRLSFPPALAISTALLFSGSFALNRAAFWVRRERQDRFRNWLRSALILGTLFIGVQMYALLCLIPKDKSATETSLGVKPFVLVFAGLHAMHFFIATLFVAFVVARTVADRYDHEYHWGVTFCAWFWHALGLAWLAILAIFAIAM